MGYDVLQSVQSYLIKEKLLPFSSSLLISCSGGMDSICLVDILQKLSRYFDWTIIVAHYNHGQRKELSDQDALWVQNFCKELKLPCVIGQDVHHKKDHIFSEDVLRNQRYAFLKKMAKTHFITNVVTGHHQNDQAETLLQRVIRGTALNGLRGIPPQRSLEAFDNSIVLVRPLLCLTRENLRSYATESKLAWREDHTNQKNTFFRNRIRNELLPLLKTYNPNVVSRINNLALIAREQNLFIESVYEEHKEKVMCLEHGDLILNLQYWKELPSVLRNRFLYGMLKTIFYPQKEVNSSHIRELEKICYSTKTHIKSSFIKNYCFWKSYKQVKIHCVKKDQLSFIRKKISIPETIFFEKTKECLKTSFCHSNEDVALIETKSSPHNVYCDYQKVKTSLEISNCSLEDTFIPLGSNSLQKIKHFFAKQKIPQWKRESIKVMRDREKIIWICGYRLDQRVLCDNKTKKILHLQINQA